MPNRDVYTFPEWQGPIPANAILWFTDPNSDEEYRFLPNQLTGLESGAGKTYGQLTYQALRLLRYPTDPLAKPGVPAWKRLRVTNRTDDRPDVYVAFDTPDARYSYLASEAGVLGTYDLDEDEFVPLAPEGGAEARFTITPVVSDGDIQAGTTYEDISSEELWRLKLEPYLAPAFAAFQIGGQGSRTVLVGTSFPAGFKSFTWATSQAANVAANSVTLRDETADTTLVSNTANDGVQSLSTAAFTAVKGTSRLYSISATDTRGNTLTAKITISGQHESYFGYSPNASLNAAQVVALGNAQLQGSRARTVAGVTATNGDYFYYAYEAAEGDLTGVILDGAAPILGAFQKLGDVAATNSAGAAVTLRVYRSNAPNAFSNNTLAFS